MEDRNVPYIVYEDTMARFERTIRRLIVAVIIAVVLFFASNAFWLYEWCQYDYTDVTVDSDDGPANYIGASGVIYNGSSKSEKENAQE